MAKPRYEPPTVFDRDADMRLCVSYDFLGGAVTHQGFSNDKNSFYRINNKFDAPKRADLAQKLVNEGTNGLATLAFIQTQWIGRFFLSSIAYPFGHPRVIEKKDYEGDENLVGRMVVMANKSGALYKGQWFSAGSIRSPHGQDINEPLNMATETLIIKYSDVCKRMLAPFIEFLQNSSVNGGK